MAQIQFNEVDIEKVQEGNFASVANKIQKTLLSGENIKFADLQQLAFENRDVQERYKFELKNTFKNNLKVQFTLDQAEVSKQVDTLPEVATEALLRDNTLLANMDIRNIDNNGSFVKMTELNEELDAEVLAADAAGTSATDTLRVGDILLPQANANASKVQASFVMDDIAMFFNNNVSILDYQRRLVNRVENKVIDRVLFAGQGVSNGTARAQGQIRGIVNNYGVNGTGDATNYIGAIEFANKAAVDAASGLTSDNPYDTVYQAKSILLPKNVSELEESMYVFVMNRVTWGKIKTAKDLNGRYLAHSAIDPVTGKAVRLIDGTPVVLHTSVPDNKVFMIPPKFYTLAMVGGIRSINDEGLVQIKEGKINFVARTYIDGSMNYGFKYKAGTSATIGTTPLDNQQQNVFRYFGIN